MPDFFQLSPSEYELLEELPVCGCGQPEVAYACYHMVLKTAAES
jgi:hypothetical protein